ncbi:MAG: molecular chaperone [Betaproteobacteria bacterium]
MKRPVGFGSQHGVSNRALHLLFISSGLRRILIAALAVISVYCIDTYAGSFSVNPVRVELSAQRMSAVVEVENTSSGEVTVEARTFGWAQHSGKDQLSPTREVIVTPQVFCLKSGAKQLLRLGMLRKPDPLNELPYRLLIEEIPPPPSAEVKGLRVALRISIPVFLRPPVEAKEKVHAELRQENNQQVRVVFSNTGNASAALSNLSISEQQSPQQSIASHSGVIYLLPGQQRELLLQATRLPVDQPILIQAQSPSGPVTLHAVLGSQ